MPKVKVYNINAEACGTMTLDDAVFGVGSWSYISIL